MPHLTQRQWSVFGLLGVVGILIPNANIYAIAPHLPSGLLAVIVNTVPIFTYILALSFGEERFTTSRLYTLILMLCGLGLVIFFQHTGTVLTLNRWALQALISPLCFALTAVMISKYPQKLKPIVLATGMMLCAGLLIAPWVLYTHQLYLPNTTYWQGRDWAILLEIILSSMGYIVFFELLLRAGAVYYAFVGGVVAIVGLLWGSVFFHEHYPPFVLLGISLIVLSIFLNNTIQPAYKKNR